MLNPAFQLDRDRATDIKKADYKRMMTALNQTLAFESIFSTLWYSKLPCLDIKGLTAVKSGERSAIKLCQWTGQVLIDIYNFLLQASLILHLSGSHSWKNPTYCDYQNQ